MHKNKQSVIYCLFLIFFVCYAISPLSLTCTVKKIVDDEYAVNEAATSYEGLNIFLLEVICAKLDAKKDADQTNSTVRVLIRKARAILPENTNLRSIPLDSVTLSENIISYFYYSLSKIVAYSNEPYSKCEFNPLHSGPAPPTV